MKPQETEFAAKTLKHQHGTQVDARVQSFQSAERCSIYRPLRRICAKNRGIRLVPQTVLLGRFVEYTPKRVASLENSALIMPCLSVFMHY
jgi:hypothetical protein